MQLLGDVALAQTRQSKPTCRNIDVHRQSQMELIPEHCEARIDSTAMQHRWPSAKNRLARLQEKACLSTRGARATGTQLGHRGLQPEVGASQPRRWALSGSEQAKESLAGAGRAPEHACGREPSSSFLKAIKDYSKQGEARPRAWPAAARVWARRT